MYKTALFDWDGTLIDSRSALIKLYNEMAGKNGYKQIHDDKLSELSRLPIRERLRALEIPYYHLPSLIRKLKRAQHQRADIIEIVPGISAVLNELKNSGIHLHLLSSNSRTIIERILVQHRLPAFESVCGDVPLFGKHRAIR